MKDLTPGMILKGTVRNVIDFGAFVDIGVHQDGLVHISQMSSTKRVEHPLDVVSVGDIVDVRVIDVDIPKARISLSMILDEKRQLTESTLRIIPIIRITETTAKETDRTESLRRKVLTFQVLLSSCINRSIVWKIELNSTA